MTRTIVAVCLAALTVAAPAQADHRIPLDWPTTTVAVNGGSCPSPECRWIKIIDRTGFGSAWRFNILVPALQTLSAANDDPAGRPRLQWTVTTGTTISCTGGTTCDPHLHATPLGAITLLRRFNFPSGADTVSCDDPSFPETWKVEPYCAGDYEHHVTKAIVPLNCNSTGCAKGHTLHEIAHAFGLADTYIFPGCGVGGTDIMCQLSSYFFNAHSRAVFDANYGHTP